MTAKDVDVRRAGYASDEVLEKIALVVANSILDSANQHGFIFIDVNPGKEDAAVITLGLNYEEAEKILKYATKEVLTTIAEADDASAHNLGTRKH